MVLASQPTQLAVKNKKNKEAKNTNTNQTTTEEANANTNQTATGTVNAGNLMAEAKKLNLDWNNPSWDLFLAAFFVVGALLYGMSLGKDRIIAILVSIYMALAVVNALPDFVLNIKINENFSLQITAFISVFVVLFFLLSRSAILNSMDTSSQGKWWQVIIFSLLHVGLLISVSLSFMPAMFLTKFSAVTQFIFTNEWTKFAWIIAPIIAMIFFGRRDENDD